jgi:ABC-type phosphate transport system auxiliary subunit
MQALASWLDNFTGASGAPWIWWAAALVIVLFLLLLGMKALGLLPR